MQISKKLHCITLLLFIAAVAKARQSERSINNILRRIDLIMINFAEQNHAEKIQTKYRFKHILGSHRSPRFKTKYSRRNRKNVLLDELERNYAELGIPLFHAKQVKKSISTEEVIPSLVA